MNILLISPYFSPMVGGVETHLDDLCNFFNEKKHSVFVRTYKALGVKNRGQTNEKKGYIHVHRLWWPDFNLIFKLEPYPGLKFFYIFLGLFFDSLFFLVKNSKGIDVIQAHGFIAGAIAVISGKIFHKRVVINTHVGFNLSESLMTKIIKWILVNADKILVLTKGVKKSLIDIGVPEEKISIYHYWVDQKIFKREKDAKKKLGWENKFIVLFVGRLIAVKGVMKIFDIAEKLSEVTFAIVGSGPLNEELRRKSREYKNIQFIGNIDNKSLPIFYSAADLLLIPSQIIEQEYEEGIPRVMIEALFCGLPIISTPSGGIPDVFSEKIGRLVQDNSKSMETVLKKLNRDKNTLESLSNNCRPFALKYFSDKNAQIIENSLS